MNIFTKLIAGILFLGTSQHLFPQTLRIPYSKYDEPFGDDIAAYKQITGDTLWLPAATHSLNTGVLSSRHIYEYHENGLLKRITTYSDDTEEVVGIDDFNNTYLDPLINIPDTIFKHGYTDYMGTYYPPSRSYYNNRQADSSYFEEYYQVWDGEKWNTQERFYAHLLDTATVLGFQDHVEAFNKDGVLTQGMKTFFTFDEQGNVSEVVIENYNTATGEYETFGKFVYLYDTDGKCHTREYYAYSAPDTWQLTAKLNEIKWFEFHGFDNGDMLFYGQNSGLYTFYSPKNKNKLAGYKFYPSYNGNLYLHHVATIDWNIDPFSYHSFNHSGYNMCLDGHYYYEYNERYHLTAYGQVGYNFWDCDTVPFTYIKDDYINKYDNRGRRYEYIQNQEVLNDSLFYLTHIYAVDSFTYVVNTVNEQELELEKHTLLIVPNPSNETVRITAADDIATITLYASDGRLAYSRDGAGKEMTVNTQGLATGVYVVQVRLRNGGVQTGKVVVAR